MFKYKDIHFGDDLFVQRITRSILAPQTLETLKIPGRSGVIFNRRDRESRVIPVEVIVNSESDKSIREKLRDLAYHLDSDEPGPLIFDDESDKWINAILSGESEIDEIVSHGQGVIEFFCPDPFWYAVDDDVFTYNQPGSYDFLRQGTAKSYPLFEISGSNEGGTISISINNETVEFTGALNEGETLMIDSNLMTAYRLTYENGQVSALNDLTTLDFPITIPGVNTVEILESGNASMTEVKILCRSRWL